MPDRRSFLSGLASLPLIGGSVALIGKPTAAAAAVTPELLATYDEWLDLERSWLLMERYAKDDDFADHLNCRPRVGWIDDKTGKMWTSHRVQSFSGFDHSRPSTRAAVILSAAGVPLTGSEL